MCCLEVPQSKFLSRACSTGRGDPRPPGEDGQSQVCLVCCWRSTFEGYSTGLGSDIFEPRLCVLAQKIIGDEKTWATAKRRFLINTSRAQIQN